MSWAQLVLDVLGIVGGLGGLAALIMVPLQRRKLKVDAASVIVDSAMDLLQPLRQRIEELEKDLTKVERIVHDIRTELAGPRPGIEKMRGLVGLIPRNGN